MATIGDAPRLSDGYNENVLVLLVQSPNVIFAYLELAETFWSALVQHGRPVMRLYDVTGSDHPADRPVDEVELPPFTTNWYFRGLAAGRTYTAELGWKEEGELFVSLLRSNAAATPANERATPDGAQKTGTGLPPRAEEAWDEETDLPTSYWS